MSQFSFVQSHEFNPAISLQDLRAWAGRHVNPSEDYKAGSVTVAALEAVDGLLGEQQSDDSDEDGDEDVEGGEGKGVESPVSLDSRLRGDSLVELLRRHGVCDEEDGRHVSELKLSVGALCSLTSAEWSEVFPTLRVALRKELQKFLKDCGCELLMDRVPVSAGRHRPSKKELEAKLAIAMDGDDFDAAEKILSELSKLGDGPDAKDPRDLAKDKVQEYEVKLDQAKNARDIAECRTWKKALDAARAAAAGGSSNAEYSRFLAIEEKLRKAAQPPATSSSRATLIQEKLASFLNKGSKGGGLASLSVRSAPGAKIKGPAPAPGVDVKSYSMLPPLTEDEEPSSGMDNVLKMYELSDVNEKYEPAHELRKLAQTHAVLHPEVRHKVPVGQAGAEAWIDSCAKKYRKGNQRLSRQARSRLVPSEPEVTSMFYVAKDMIRAAAPVVQDELHGSYVIGYLALVGAYCASQGSDHYDYFFDRDRNGDLPSSAVFNAVRKYAAEYHEYLDLRQKITHEKEMSKAKYAALHREYVSETTLKPDMASRGGSKGAASQKVSAWSPSSFAWTPKLLPGDKCMPTKDNLLVMRGYYEACGSISPTTPGCISCGLAHDEKHVCHWHKFPAHRSPAFKRSFRTALKNGYMKLNAVDEWNTRPGRLQKDKCDVDGFCLKSKKQVHLRPGVPGGPQ